LWILILVKSAIILTVLFLYFPHILNDYETDMDKADFVADNLLKTQ
jgi:type III secretory pathway component EscT